MRQNATTCSTGTWHSHHLRMATHIGLLAEDRSDFSQSKTADSSYGLVAILGLLFENGPTSSFHFPACLN